MMGRGNNNIENNNNNTLLYSSSIALLQERFRQLQKVKEMREERELRRRASTVAASAAAAAAGGERRPGWFFHPDLARPSRPLDGPMYQGLSSTDDDDRAEFSALETASLPAGFRPNKPAHAVSSHDLRNCTGKDVDTSLHL